MKAFGPLVRFYDLLGEGQFKDVFHVLQVRVRDWPCSVYLFCRIFNTPPSTA